MLVDIKIDIPAYAVAITAVVLFALNAFGVFFTSPDTANGRLISSMVTVVFAFAATSALIYMRFFLLKLNRKWAGHWAWMAAGFGLWLIAEIVWMYLALGEEPQGLTPADALWLLGYVAMFIGLIGANLGTIVVFKPRDTLAALGFSALALAIVVFVLLPSLSADAPLLEKAVQTFYPIGDIAVVFLAFRLATTFMGSRLRTAWGVLLAGLVLFAIADAWMAYLNLYDLKNIGDPSDFVYNASYILVAMGALLFESMSRSGFKQAEETRVVAEQTSGQLDGLLLRKKGEQAVSITTTKNFVDVDIAALKLLTKEEGAGGILVCFDRTPEFLLERIKEAGVDAERAYVIAVGHSNGHAYTNVSYVDSLGDLSAIKMTITSALKAMNGKCKKQSIVVDGIPTLTLYNDLNRLGQFLHDVNIDMRAKDVYQVILLSQNGEINQYVMRFCDTNLSLI